MIELNRFTPTVRRACAMSELKAEQKLRFYNMAEFSKSFHFHICIIAMIIV